MTFFSDLSYFHLILSVRPNGVAELILRFRLILCFFCAVRFHLNRSVRDFLYIAEWAIGRAGRSDYVGSFKKLGGGAWTIVGWFGFIAAFVILSYYSVIAGWIIYYVKYSFTGLIAAVRHGGSEDIFRSLVTNPLKCITLQFVIMLIAVGVSIKGRRL